MTDKELDELFRNSFSDHEMPVPEEMWQRVNPQKERKRRAAFWWWSSRLGVAALLLVGAFMWWDDTSSTPAKDIAFARVSPGTEKAPSSANVNDSAAQALKPVESSDPNIKAQAGAAVTKSFIVKSKDRYKRQVSVGHNPDTYLSSRRRSRIKPDEVADNRKEETTINAAGKTREESISSSTLHTKPAAIPPAESASADSTATVTGSIVTKADTAAAFTAASAVQVQLPKRRKTSIELSAAGFAGDRNVYGVKKEEPAFAITVNEPHEKTMVRGYSLNLRIEKPVGIHWSFKTGLQFLQARQSVTYNAEAVSRYAVVNTLGAGADTTQFTQISLHRPVTKSSYNSFNVPLLLSYHTNGKKMSVGATGGVLLNLFSWYNGDVPDGNYTRALAAKNVFRSNHGSSLYLSLPVTKSFGAWQAFIEPQLQHSLTSLTQSKASFKQKMTYYGVGIGIKKSLHK